MRKILAVVISVLFFTVSAVSADFSESSDVFDPDLAQYALRIAENCYSPAMQEAILSVGGYQREGVWNAVRSEDDSGHKAAYSVFNRVNEEGRSEVIIAIRGTRKGEWKLNMDLMPSGDYDLPYAENFALAAEDILTAQAEYLDSLSDPVFLVTGHSRGAAVANVLGVRLTDRFGAENVFVYTFATPRTVRGEYPRYGNIFNIINPADLVTFLPVPGWGFERYGVDIQLPVDDPALYEAARDAYARRSDRTGAFPASGNSAALVRDLVSLMEKLAPDVRDADTVLHALSHPGTAEDGEDGMTANAVMLMIFEGTSFSGSSFSETPASLTRNENDFTPLFAAMRAFGGSLITNMHMPAVYGAWLTAAFRPVP